MRQNIEATPRELWRNCYLAARCIQDGWRGGEAYRWNYALPLLTVWFEEEDELGVWPEDWAEPFYLELFGESREALAGRIYAGVRQWPTWGECMDAGMASLRSWAGVRQ